MHCTLDVFFPKHVTTLSCRNHLFLLFIFFELGGTLSLECREDHSWERGWVGLLESLETCWSGFKFQLRHFPAVWLQASCPWPSAFSPVMGMLTPNSSGCCEAWKGHMKSTGQMCLLGHSLSSLSSLPSYLIALKTQLHIQGKYFCLIGVHEIHLACLNLKLIFN